MASERLALVVVQMVSGRNKQRIPFLSSTSTPGMRMPPVAPLQDESLHDALERLRGKLKAAATALGCLQVRAAPRERG